MVRIGLTGGIGSGKSTVGRMLIEWGVTVIDADAISRALTAANGSAIGPIQESFGSNMITPDGALDRERMRSLVFNDPSGKSRLEGIIHPLVGIEIESRTYLAELGNAPCVVVDIPLLVESAHWRHKFDRIMVVDCSPATQIRRVVERDQLSIGQVESIMRTQATRDQRIRVADIVIYNDEVTMRELQFEVDNIRTDFGL